MHVETGEHSGVKEDEECEDQRQTPSQPPRPSAVSFGDWRAGVTTAYEGDARLLRHTSTSGLLRPGPNRSSVSLKPQGPDSSWMLRHPLGKQHYTNCPMCDPGKKHQKGDDDEREKASKRRGSGVALTLGNSHT